MLHNPAVNKAHARSGFYTEPRKVKQMHIRMAAQMRGHFLPGPSAEAFLNEHLPWNSATPADYRKKRPVRARIDSLISMADVPESKMYNQYIKVFQGWPLQLKKSKPNCLSTPPKFGKFCNPDPNCDNLAVDIGVYDADNVPEGRSTDYSLMETQVELKACDNYDALMDLSDDTNEEATVSYEEEGSEEGQEEELYDEDLMLVEEEPEDDTVHKTLSNG